LLADRNRSVWPGDRVARADLQEFEFDRNSRCRDAAQLADLHLY
jgi:hypothetical protein